MYFTSFALYYAVKALFFNDEVMHTIYQNQGVYDFIFQLPQIIYSTIISAIIGVILSKLSLTQSKIVEIKKTHHHYFIIFEYCNGGTLKSCLEKYKNIYNRPFTEKIVQHIMRQIVSAVKYIHDLNIIHRNLSLENIVVNFEKENDKTQVNLMNAQVKIINFFFSGHKGNTESLKSVIGSPQYMAPSILKHFCTGGVNQEFIYDEKMDKSKIGRASCRERV